MAKTLRIEIKSTAEVLAGFRDAFKAAESGRRVRRRDGVHFTSVEAARNLLTPIRRRLSVASWNLRRNLPAPQMPGREAAWRKKR